MVGFTADGPARDRVLQLMAEKDRIESEIRDQATILEVENNVGMHGPLVDDQGFPRSDIDVYKVRHARHRIICKYYSSEPLDKQYTRNIHSMISGLQNDHKAIMKHIEQGLVEVHSEFLPGSTSGQATTSKFQTNGHNGHTNGNQSGDAAFNEDCRGFALVNFVQQGSPADLSGLCSGDEILQFGSITPNNFREITQINEIVAHSVNQSIRLLVKRNNSINSLSVTPRPWSQPGLLGCQIVRNV